MQTRLTNLLSIDLPIVQAPIAGSNDSALAVAVGAAGSDRAGIRDLGGRGPLARSGRWRPRGTLAAASSLALGRSQPLRATR